MKEFQQLFAHTSRLKGLMIITGALSIVSALLTLVMPFTIKFATDYIVAVLAKHAEPNFGYILLLIGIAAGVSVLGALLLDVRGFLGDQLSIRTRRQLSTKYYEHLLRLPQTYYDTEITGTIINRLNRAIVAITQFVQFFTNNLLSMLLGIIFSIVIMLWYSWPLALLFVFLVPVNLYLTYRTSGKWQKYEKKINKHFDIASGRFAEVIGQMRIAKSFGSEKREVRLFDSRMQHMTALTKKQSTHWHTYNFMRGLVFAIIQGSMLAVIFYEVLHGRFSLGDAIMLITLVQQAVFPINNLSYFVDSYQRAAANSKEYVAAMNEAPEPDDTTRKVLKKVKGRVEYKHVYFSYEDKNQVLEDISFTLEPGKKLALVGESGGGKSTTVYLLMRLYQPDSGTISIDGVDISTVSRKSLRDCIATVFQDASLFSGTIRENVAYGKPGASDDEVRRALKAANALSFVEEMPSGLETEIGERGIKLSGGQKQRIAIARALLKDAPILILDEATSSLDGKAEQEVQGALDRLMKHRTTLIIAHRLSTIAHVDMIVTLKSGKVDEVGSPKQLATTGGIYAQLLALQLGATEQAKEQLANYDINA